ncbi:MAG TPA: DUF1573 domain-containing protein [Planctomycetaceae bacterium]|nr:DUF1573 domain-containing protein [Planctomycetaceae bacterium]
MQTHKLAFGMVVAIVCVSAAVWAARFAPWVDRAVAAPNPLVSRLREMKEGAARRKGEKPEAGEQGAGNLDPTVDARPPVLVQGPFPKATAGEQVYQFGHTGIGDRQTHRFRIENKGQAPLLIAKGPTECKCTISNLAANEVPPGGFTEVEIAWAPLEADPTFEKSAIIWTNDPKMSEIRFRIAGKVGRGLAVSPVAWHAGIVAEDQDAKAVGIVVSEVEAGFKILSVKSTDDNIKVSYKPMTPGALEHIGMLAGYEFTTTVGKGIPIGNFRSRLEILTSLEPKTPLVVDLTAVRPGPIRFLSAVPIVGHVLWNAEKSRLNLGRFRHEVGSKTALTALISDMKGKFQMLGSKSSDSFVKVSVEPNPATGSGESQGIRFVFEVPPGSPPVNYFTNKPVHVTVQTNHPKLKNLDFDLEFVSL